MTSYTKHNPDLVNPLIEKILKSLGDGWLKTSYGNDSVASVSRDLPHKDSDQDVLEIFLPNSKEYNADEELFNTYSIRVLESNEEHTFDTLEEVIEKAKEIERGHPKVKRKVDYEFFLRGFWDSVQFGYVPDFENDLQANSWGLGIAWGKLGNGEPLLDCPKFLSKFEIN